MPSCDLVHPVDESDPCVNLSCQVVVSCSTFDNLTNYGMDVMPQWVVAFVLFMPLGASSRLRSQE